VQDGEDTTRSEFENGASIERSVGDRSRVEVAIGALIQLALGDASVAATGLRAKVIKSLRYHPVVLS